MWFNARNPYVPLPHEEAKPEKTSLQRGFDHGRVLMYGLMLLLSMLSGVMVGMRIAAPGEHSPDVPVEISTLTFQYNRSFSYPPSEHTNRAWRDIFPAEGGFFVHPTIAPTRSTFSVFHQLHCLNGLRGGYWANQLAASKGQKQVDADLPVDIQTSHMRHCIDLLRQSLMCHGDVTLEVVDEDINGVHGFRTPHKCIDWENLKEWTSQQQAKKHVDQIV